MRVLFVEYCSEDKLILEKKLDGSDVLLFWHTLIERAVSDYATRASRDFFDLVVLDIHGTSIEGPALALDRFGEVEVVYTSGQVAAMQDGREVIPKGPTMETLAGYLRKRSEECQGGESSPS